MIGPNGEIGNNYPEYGFTIITYQYDYSINGPHKG